MREGVRETFPASEGTRNAPSRGVPKCEFDWAKPQKLFIRDLLFMAQAFVINARLRERIMNAKDDRKRSGKGQKAVLFRKSRVAFHRSDLKLLK